MSMRDEFESHFAGVYGMAKDELNQYVNTDTAAAWGGWQAAREQGAEPVGVHGTDADRVERAMKMPLKELASKFIEATDRANRNMNALKAVKSQTAEPVAWMNQRGDVISDNEKHRLTHNQGIVGAATATNFRQPLYAQPQIAGVIPDGWSVQCREGCPKTIHIYRKSDGAWCGGGVEDDDGAAGLRYEFLSALLSNNATKPTTPQPAGDWIKCSERLPTEADGKVWIYDKSPNAGVMGPWDWDDVDPGDGDTHWKPTGLKRPQPPRGQEGGHE